MGERSPPSWTYAVFGFLLGLAVTLTVLGGGLPSPAVLLQKVPGSVQTVNVFDGNVSRPPHIAEVSLNPVALMNRCLLSCLTWRWHPSLNSLLQPRSSCTCRQLRSWIPQCH